MSAVRIYTDGACLHNPGPGGWAALIISSDNQIELSGGARHTTNNRMELIAAIKGLEACSDTPELFLYSDSKYMLDGVTAFIKVWRTNGWVTTNRKPVKNIDLWQRLDGLVESREIQWRWVKGHSGIPENERVDFLAREQAQRFQAFIEQNNE